MDYYKGTGCVVKAERREFHLDPKIPHRLPDLVNGPLNCSDPWNTDYGLGQFCNAIIGGESIKST